MCMLSLIHGEPELVKTVLTNVSILNARDGNKDGFGIFCVEKKDTWKYPGDVDKIIFSDDYYDTIDDMCSGLEKVTFLAHTRSASVGFKINSIENTHPFFIDNISLMHNGTLEPIMDDLKVDKKIDSYWFLNHLVKKMGKDNLAAKHIVESYKDFSGKFAFLIYDHRQDENIFVVKGRLTHLFKTSLCDSSGKELCYIINTDGENIENMIFPYYIRTLGLPQVEIKKPLELVNDSIYIFNIKSGKLQRTTTAITERVSTRQTWIDNAYYSRSYSPRPTGQLEGVSGKIAHLADDMSLTLLELNYLYYLKNGDTLLSADYQDLGQLEDLLKDLLKLFNTNKGNKKESSWINILDEFYHRNQDRDCIDLYNEFGLQFPWFLNSKKGLKRVLTSVQSRN